jgi:hypothetical protein
MEIARTWLTALAKTARDFKSGVGTSEPYIVDIKLSVPEQHTQETAPTMM